MHFSSQICFARLGGRLKNTAETYLGYAANKGASGVWLQAPNDAKLHDAAGVCCPLH